MATTWRLPAARRALSWIAVMMLAGAFVAVPLTSAAVSRPARMALSIAGWRRSVAGLPAASGSVSLQLELRGRDPSGLQALLAAQRDPDSSQYHRWLTPAQYQAEFAPSPAEVSAVEGWARSEGLRAESVADAVSVSGSAAGVGQALGTTVVRAGPTYGTTSQASLPAAIASDVTDVVSGELPAPVPVESRPARTDRPPGGAARPGALPRRGRAPSDRVTRGTARPARPGVAALRSPTRALPATNGPPTPCAAASGAGGTSLSAVGQHYGIGQLQTDGDLGAGETIAIYEAEGFSMGDIDSYEACLGVDTSVTVAQIDGGGYPGPGANLEDDLDIEQIIAQAPQASIVVYEGGGDSDSSEVTAEDEAATWAAMVDGATVNGSSVELSSDGWTAEPTLGIGTVLPPAEVMSTSWGWYWIQGVPSVEPIAEVLDPIYEQAAAEGISTFAASGDSDDPGTLYPADSPYVTAVGGTMIEGSGPDEGWIGSTGGFSPYEPEPAFEDAVESAGGGYRGVPDVAGDAWGEAIYDNTVPLLDDFDFLTTGSWTLSDTAGHVSCGPIAAQSSCDAGVPGETDTYTVSYTGTGGYGDSSAVLDADGAATSTIQLVWAESDDELYAYVFEPFALPYSQPLPVTGGTVSFSDGDGDMPSSCASVAVAIGGVAVCDGVTLSAMAALGDTISVSYSGSASAGASSNSATAAHGSPASAYTSPAVSYDGSGTPQWEDEPYQVAIAGDWPWYGGVGGTSAAAPLWAGLVADLDNTCTAPLGQLAADLDSLYGRVGDSLYGTVLQGVVAGTTSTNGYTTTSEGWNAVTGMGTPIASGMTCPQISGISESQGSAGDAVTVSGSGLSLASFRFGTAPATVTSQSASSARLVVPPGSGTVEVRAELLGAGSGVPFSYEESTTSTTGGPTSTTGTSSTSTTTPSTTSLATTSTTRASTTSTTQASTTSTTHASTTSTTQASTTSTTQASTTSTTRASTSSTSSSVASSPTTTPTAATTSEPSQASGGASPGSGSPVATTETTPSTTVALSPTTSAPPRSATGSGSVSGHLPTANPQSLTTDDARVSIVFSDRRAPGWRARVELRHRGARKRTWRVRLSPDGEVTWQSPRLTPGKWTVELVVEGKVVRRTEVHVVGPPAR